MLTKVKDDRRGSSRLITLPLIAVFAVFSSVAAAQTGASDTPFSAKVLDLSDSTTRIMVPVDRSVTVETTVETTRADVIATHIVDVQVLSPTRILLTGQRYGSTSIVLMGPANKQYVFNVDVELDLEQLNNTLATLDPLGHVEAVSVRGHIILSGTVSSAARAEKMVELSTLFLPTSDTGEPATGVQNHIEVAGEQQVLIRCLVAEMSRTALRQLSINGFLAGDNFKDAFFVNQLGGVNPINIGTAADALVSANMPFLTGTEGIPLGQASTLSAGFPRVQMQLFLKAMAENSLLSILAEPNLTAISGETATFLAGGEFPVPVPQGNQTVTIEFKNFGVELNFTPVVKGGEIIRLRVHPSVSELDFSTAVQLEGFVIPGLTSRTTETTVELGSGQTIAIGGLLNEQVRGIASRIPAIGDVPVLGALFRSVDFQRSLTELVILVTPEIVAPLHTQQIARLPFDGRTDPSDFELYGLGLLEGLNCEENQDQPGCGEPDGAVDEPPALGSQPQEASIHGPWGLEGIVEAR